MSWDLPIPSTQYPKVVLRVRRGMTSWDLVELTGAVEGVY